MSRHVIVWDLETVPDIAGYAAANGLAGKSDEEIREALGNKFPKHIYHAIVCIGALVAHKERDHWAVDAIGAPHVGERPEKELIASFVDRIAQLTPQLVTFNGNTFDLPVLRYRAMIHAVAAPGLTARPYFNAVATSIWVPVICDIPPGRFDVHRDRVSLFLHANDLAIDAHVDAFFLEETGKSL